MKQVGSQTLRGDESNGEGTVLRCAFPLNAKMWRFVAVHLAEWPEQALAVSTPPTPTAKDREWSAWSNAQPGPGAAAPEQPVSIRYRVRDRDGK